MLVSLMGRGYLEMSGWFVDIKEHTWRDNCEWPMLSGSLSALHFAEVRRSGGLCALNKTSSEDGRAGADGNVGGAGCN